MRLTQVVSDKVMAADRRRIENGLGMALRFGAGVPARLSRAMSYAVMGPGKRLRPILALEAFRASSGKSIRQVLPFCYGLELIHTFSLIHDDLPSMDDDDFRRGRPSLHRKFDEATAILAADALFCRAFELFATAPGDERRKVEAIRVISHAVGPEGMTGGQVIDIFSSRRLNGRKLTELHRKKTAEFIAAALVAGAIVGGASARHKDMLWHAGINLGLLFQTTDDLLDEAQASDEGRATALAVSGRVQVEQRARRQARMAEQSFKALGPSYGRLAALPEVILRRSS